VRITLYLDEDIPLALALSLSNRGVDVVTTQAAGNIGKSDREQLTFAAGQGRALLTHNKKDFILLHQECVNSGVAHSGIIVSDQVPVGVLLRRLMRLWFTVSREDMGRRVEFLSSWRYCRFSPTEYQSILALT
jgi:hypothetical protein